MKINNFLNVSLMFLLIIFSRNSFSLFQENFSFLPNSNNESPSTSTNFISPNHQISGSFGGDGTTFCGPSLQPNSLECFVVVQNSIQYSKIFPFPGTISGTPLYVNGSWIVASTKGFLFKIEADEKFHFPKIQNQWLNFWGLGEKQLLTQLIPKAEVQQTHPALEEKKENTENILDYLKWNYYSSSSFVGKPIYYKNKIYILSSYQYLYCFDFDTGRLLWTTQTGKSFALNYLSTSLEVLNDELIVENTQGNLVAVSSEQGNISWTYHVPPASQQERIVENLPTFDKFTSIIAPFLIDNNNIYVGNSESLFQKIDLRTKKQIWQKASGTTTKPILIQDKIIYSDFKNNIYILNKNNGEVIFKTQIQDDELITSSISVDPEHILFLSSYGNLYSFDITKTKITLVHQFYKRILDDIMTINHNECIHTSYNILTCFQSY